jgi:NAD(P)-dependent dehydrogenase (short-subunit alcohol dehydrogenase family)
MFGKGRRQSQKQEDSAFQQLERVPEALVNRSDASSSSSSTMRRSNDPVQDKSEGRPAIDVSKLMAFTALPEEEGSHAANPSDPLEAAILAAIAREAMGGGSTPASGGGAAAPPPVAPDSASKGSSAKEGATPASFTKVLSGGGDGGPSLSPPPVPKADALSQTEVVAKVSATSQTREVERFHHSMQTDPIAFLDSGSTSSGQAAVAEESLPMRKTLTMVVGATGGIGHAVSRLIVKAGGSIILLARTQSSLDEVATELREMRHSDRQLILHKACDARDEDALDRLVERLGETMIDHVVIASSANPYLGSFRKTSLRKAQDHFSGKFWLAYSVAQVVSRQIKEGGSITLLSGITSQQPFRKGVHVSCANAAVEALCKSLALELGPKVRCNCVRPGLLSTSHMFRQSGAELFKRAAQSLPAGVIGTPSDVARAITFLMQNPYMTGVVLDVDGGHQISASINQVLEDAAHESSVDLKERW